VVLIAAIAGCGRGNRSDQRVRLPVDVFSDTAHVMRFGTGDSILRGAARAIRSDPIPRATVWLARVTPAPAIGIEPTLAPSESIAPPGGSWPAPPTLEVDEGLKPPIARGAARLTVPRGSGSGWVELDVRVDENGVVSDVAWAGGASDSAHVTAATAYAFAMRWFPALQGGRPVAVWCRQRVDFGR
jgi:hypothetical protein